MYETLLTAYIALVDLQVNLLKFCFPV